MNTKPEELYFASIKKIIKDTYKLKNDYIDEPSFDPDGELIIIPREKFRSQVTQALMITQYYKFIGSGDSQQIYLALARLRDADFDCNTQAERCERLIELLDAIVHQIESGILYFSAGTIPTFVQGSLNEISGTSLNYIEEQSLRDSISKDISELVRAAQSKMFKTVALIAGSITESVLLGVANLNPELSKTYLKKPDKFPGQCGIEELADICSKAGVITDMALSAEILHDYRDHIHPNKHTKSQTELNDHSVSMIIGILGQLLQNLAASEQKGLMKRYKEQRLGV